ncbi:MAG: hypothetical protein ACI8PZ_002909 [Myxococcota bacterium]|jgi:hypothetical protein
MAGWMLTAALLGCAPEGAAPPVVGAPPEAPPCTVVAPPEPGERTCFADVDPDALPDRWSATGCAPVGGPGLVPYSVAAPLWSDGADKQRWLAIPEGEVVTALPDGRLDLPVGTLLLKRFAWGDTPLETRVMLATDAGWVFATYVWDVHGTEAWLAGPDAETIDRGGKEWTVPSAAGCLYCHGESAVVLGPEVAQLAHAVCVDGEPIDQLAHLEATGVFAGAVPDVMPMVDPEDPTADIADRARSYLHVNCAHCHRPGGWTPPEMDLDLRWHLPLADTQTCDVPIQYLAPPASRDVRVQPGHPELSHLYLRMTPTGGGFAQMPSVGTAPDPTGLAVVRAWITSLDSCP